MEALVCQCCMQPDKWCMSSRQLPRQAGTNLLDQQARHGVALLLQGVSDCMLGTTLKVPQNPARTASAAQLLCAFSQQNCLRHKQGITVLRVLGSGTMPRPWQWGEGVQVKSSSLPVACQPVWHCCPLLHQETSACTPPSN